MVDDKPISVVFVDDDAAIIRCVGAFVEKHGVKVVGYAEHAQAGLALALECKPDMVVSDVHMPGMDAFAACRQIIELTDDKTKVLFYTGFPRDQYLDRCIAAGASGMVSKHTETITGVVAAIRHVQRGHQYFSPELARRLTELENGAPLSKLATLTHRQIATLRLLAAGETNREISERLNVSVRTVEKEISDMKEKLELNTTNELLMYAAREDLIYTELTLTN